MQHQQHVCLLCRRKFTTAEKLQRHEKSSKLHSDNLKLEASKLIVAEQLPTVDEKCSSYSPEKKRNRLTIEETVFPKQLDKISSIIIQPETTIKNSSRQQNPLHEERDKLTRPVSNYDIVDQENDLHDTRTRDADIQGRNLSSKKREISCLSTVQERAIIDHEPISDSNEERYKLRCPSHEFSFTVAKYMWEKKPQLLWECSFCNKGSFSSFLSAANHESVCGNEGKGNRNRMDGENLWSDLIARKQILSDSDNSIVQNLEFFHVSLTTIRELKLKVAKDTLGIRCIWCKKLPYSRRAKHSVFFPNGHTITSQLYDIAEKHLKVCEEVPAFTQHKSERKTKKKARNCVGLPKYMDSVQTLFGVEQTKTGIKMLDVVPNNCGSFLFTLCEPVSTEPLFDFEKKNASLNNRKLFFSGKNNTTPDTSKVLTFKTPLKEQTICL